MVHPISAGMVEAESIRMTYKCYVPGTIGIFSSSTEYIAGINNANNDRDSILRPFPIRTYFLCSQVQLLLNIAISALTRAALMQPRCATYAAPQLELLYKTLFQRESTHRHRSGDVLR